jgi:hypothetical protein
MGKPRKEIYMKELIKVTHDNDRPTVLGRDLHEFLGIERNLSAYGSWKSGATALDNDLYAY